MDYAFVMLAFPYCFFFNIMNFVQDIPGLMWQAQ